jgi:hypothetical protein
VEKPLNNDYRDAVSTFRKRRKKEEKEKRKKGNPKKEHKRKNIRKNRRKRRINRAILARTPANARARKPTTTRAKNMAEQIELVEHQNDVQMEVATTVSSSAIRVIDQSTYALACEAIAKLQGMKKKVVDLFADSKKKAAAAHKAICATEKTMLSPIEDRIEELRTATQNWYAAEQARIEAEEARRRKEAEAMAQLAEEAESAGDTNLAVEAVLEAAAVGNTGATAPKVEGTSMRVAWRAVVTDVTQVPRSFMTVNQKALDEFAKNTHGTATVPGVRFERYFINVTRATE